MEISPVTITPHIAGYCCQSAFEELQHNEYAWTHATHLLFVEQPVGVGFSQGHPPPVNEDDVSGDFATFLTNFYQVFTEYQDTSLWMFGESYAGMYVPSIARRLVRDNQKRHSPVTFPIKGIALGNGWVDAARQGPATIDYAYWHGMIDSYTKDNLHALFEQCMNRDADLPDPLHAFTTPDDCGIQTAVLQAAGFDSFKPGRGPNTYDVTTWDGYDAIIKDDSVMTRLFNDPAVKQMLHAPDEVDWIGCMPGAGRRRRLDELPGKSYLKHDQPESTVPYIAELLQEDVSVLIYNGDMDLSTNAGGSEQVLNDMKWPGQDAWYTAPRGLWIVDDEAAGYIKQHDKLQFLVVYKSGHMVPYNRPVQALDLVTRFVNGRSFHDYDLPSFAPKDDDEDQKDRTDASLAVAKTPWFLLLVVITLSFAAGAFGVTFCNRRFSHRYEPIQQTPQWGRRVELEKTNSAS
jgi:hypothetical protein